MGIMTYQFHRSNDLSPQKFEVMFLDMGENIHIHYRDLRIELSVEEFLEFNQLFTRYRDGVLKEIESGYKDGVLPNTNDTETIKTFWDKGKLQHKSPYDTNLVAIEETTDGYHIHFRNYKLLVDRNSFTQLGKAFVKSLHLLEDNKLHRDPFQLLHLNDLEPRLLSRYSSDVAEELLIEVQEKFRRKSGQVLIALGYRLISGKTSKQVYKKDHFTVVLTSQNDNALPVTDKKFIGSDVICLPIFLENYGKSLGRHDLNTLKLRIIYLLKLAEQGKISPFSLQNIYVNRHSLTPAVDIFGRKSSLDPRKEYERFNQLLVKNQLFFIKPVKTPFTDIYRESLFEKFVNHVSRHIAPYKCVSKIYLAGSVTQGHSGQYQVPFVHFEWCKLASDFDILIEIDPDFEDEIPEEWDFKFPWPKHSAQYYHLGDIGNGMDSEYAKQYPGIVFYEHMVESYLFFPSKVAPKVKEAYYEKLKLSLIHQKDNIVSWFENHYDMSVINMKSFGAMSFNKIYRVDVKDRTFVLKVYDNKYINNDDPGRIQYEIDILRALENSALPVAFPVKNKKGDYLTEKGRDKVVLFKFVSGFFKGKAKDEEARTAGKLLGRLHESLKNHRNSFQQRFNIRNPMFLWLDAYNKYQKDGTISDGIEISSYIEKLKKLDTFSVHCHGDVSPRNYLFEKDGSCSMIDFQNLGYGPAIIDLTDGVIEFASQGGAFKWGIADAFREGYEEVRQLSVDEASKLENVLICHLLIKQVRLYRNHLAFGLDLKKEKIAGLNEALRSLLDK